VRVQEIKSRIFQKEQRPYARDIRACSSLWMCEPFIIFSKFALTLDANQRQSLLSANRLRSR
jgi:hypothetical protein